MKRIMVGLISGGSQFSKDISGRTKKEVVAKARKYLRENTLPGTSSKAAIWFGNNKIVRINVRSEFGRSTPKCILKKKEILY